MKVEVDVLGSRVSLCLFCVYYRDRKTPNPYTTMRVRTSTRGKETWGGGGGERQTVRQAGRQAGRRERELEFELENFHTQG